MTKEYYTIKIHVNVCKRDEGAGAGGLGGGERRGEEPEITGTSETTCSRPLDVRFLYLNIALQILFVDDIT